MEIPGVNQDTHIIVVYISTEETTKNIIPGNLPKLITTYDNNTPKLEALERAQNTRDDIVTITYRYDTEENKE